LDWKGYEKMGLVSFIPVVIFIITAVSNGANLTDGIDGLAAGTSTISVLWVFYLSFWEYYIYQHYVHTKLWEMTVFYCSIQGHGFLWYNSYQHQFYG
jgi:phospho-N-acetylmuramoyl-pentapeptide-transferase